MDKRVHGNTDLGFVTMLVSYGGVITASDRTNIKNVKFDVDISGIKWVYLLGNDAEVTTYKDISPDTLQNLYTSDRLMLMPNFFTKMKDLKSLIYGQNNK